MDIIPQIDSKVTVPIRVNMNKETVSARELHEGLGIEKRFSAWFEQFKDLFTENEDFTSVPTSTVVNNGALRKLDDYEISIDMAKHICMMSHSERGKQFRQYFIDLEKAWNTPEQIMARALKVAEQTQRRLESMICSQKTRIEEMKPKEIFADAVSTSRTSILMGELAKLICQNGYEIGQNRLFQWMRDNGYLMQDGLSRNIPKQRFVEMGLFEVKETIIQNPDGSMRLTKTTKVTGKSQIYFINKFLDNSRTLNIH